MDIEYRPAYPKRIMEKGKLASPFRCGYFVSPYIGCEYKCVYCQECTSRELSKDFHKMVQIKLNAQALLRKEIKSKKMDVVCIKGYQPVEKEYRLTRKILEILNARSFPVHIITQSDLICKDLDILSKIAESSFCTVTFIINTLDKNISKAFEPLSPSPKKRMKAMESVADAGVQTGLALMPIIPYITDSEKQLKDLIGKAVESKASYVQAAPLKLSADFRADVIHVIKKHFPMELIKYRKLYEFGAQPDVKYTRQLMSRINSIRKKFEISDTIPHYPTRQEKKQVEIEEFFPK